MWPNPIKSLYFLCRAAALLHSSVKTQCDPAVAVDALLTCETGVNHRVAE